MVCWEGRPDEDASESENGGAALLEAWRRRSRAAFEQLSEATSSTDAHRHRIELIDSVGGLLGIESMIARHRRGRAHLDPAAHAARHARVRLALLRIATSGPSERRHRAALSTIRAALWEGDASHADQHHHTV